MKDANRSGIGFIGDIARYSLIGLLVINILSPFVILFINPEAFFLGQKIAGTPALVYALGLCLVTALVLFGLYKKTRGYASIALLYGMIFFINGYLAVMDNYGKYPPAIYWLILLLSAILFCTTLTHSGKPVDTGEKRICTRFMEKPSAGLLISASVLLGFLLFTSISLMNYEHETNDYLFAVEITPETPLYNVTIMVPLPSAISKNISEGTDMGNVFPNFRNYSQSVVETENGTMLRITAESVEKPGNGLPQEPAGVYLDFFTSNPINYSYPLGHEPVLLPKFSPEPSVCKGKKFQRILAGNTASTCLDYESTIYAVFETAPPSQTTITVSFDGTRMFSSPGSPGNHGYQDSMSVTISGDAHGWYNTTGTLIAG